MCGIIGYAGAPPPAGYAPGALPLDGLRHRGPDSQGFWTDGRCCALAQTRLAIIDLDPRADQPMLLGGRDAPRYVLTFNGEIYNYLELKEQYLADEPFFSTSDTEVLLRLWARMGPDCLPLLRGMFAFGLWDAENRALFLARDRLGKKPLVFADAGTSICFASELDALAAASPMDLELDPAALDLFFGYQFIPAPFTIYKQARKLLPAHFAVWRDGVLHMERYWEPPFPPDGERITDEAEALERAESVLREAVRIRLRADVPVGVLLSGGVDSGLVTALAAQEGAGRLRTFSVGFAEETCNELPHARTVARRYDTLHNETMLDPGAALTWLDRAVDAYGEPFGDKSALPSLLVCAEAAKHVKVVLGGDGGDEAFGGYRKYNAAGPRRALGAMAEALYLAGLGLEDLWERLPLPSALDGLPDRVLRGVSALHRVLRFGDFIDARNRPAFYREDFLAATRGVRATFERALLLDVDLDLPDVREKLFSLDWRHYLAGDLLPKMDAASMRSSLEARSPLLDQEVFALSCALAPALKLTPGMRGAGAEKRLLKHLAEKFLPPDVIYRPKQGFAIPVAAWLREPLRERMEHLLADAANPVWDFLRRSRVETLYRAHLSGAHGAAFRLWVALMAGLWFGRKGAAMPKGRSAAPRERA
ncbi:MAG: asparagine synthase (glutamine-hydrolyzing) [Desulfovibrionaceae bacterium]|jgi:asparagine synthase (glutamine-hydrolysing)|nr:asparagine synthase (glutamine-hydrolyzing) [Desulfovibrionaceae bacterium]